MKAGKLSKEQLEKLVLSQLQLRREDVLVHAGFGEDCAIIDFGDEVCLVSSDPITGAIEGIGELAVHVSCNDIAANGGTPLGIQVVLLLPESVTESQIKTIMEDVQYTASELGVEVLGGHTEITDRVKDCVISVTAVGRAPKQKYVTSDGARVGDEILITKGVGIEGTLILARDFASQLDFTVSQDDLARYSGQLSVVREGLIAAEFGVHAMHDITEGGLLGALSEVMTASHTGCEVWESAVYVPELTRQMVSHFKVNPLALLSSGSMLIVTDRGNSLRHELHNRGIPAYIVGHVTEGPEKYVIRADGSQELIPDFVEDELWRILA